MINNTLDKTTQSLDNTLDNTFGQYNELQVIFKEINEFYIYSSNFLVGTNLKISEKEDTIFIKINANDNEDIKHLESYKSLQVKWFYLLFMLNYNFETTNLRFNFNVNYIPFLEISSSILLVSLITDAQIIKCSKWGQKSFFLDAPNLKELTVNIETSKIMVLSDQTPKDFKLITEGKEGYFYDPYFEYDPCS